MAHSVQCSVNIAVILQSVCDNNYKATSKSLEFVLIKPLGRPLSRPDGKHYQSAVTQLTARRRAALAISLFVRPTIPIEMDGCCTL